MTCVLPVLIIFLYFFRQKQITLTVNLLRASSPFYLYIGRKINYCKIYLHTYTNLLVYILQLSDMHGTETFRRLDFPV
jgi:hypothetical protein